ncbi:MAG: hypothetical protein BWY52_00884 [Chloroflexi bacterium ADurb.Bin325]|nr:MAG: hypothetical protein BWY52_00884 [Chloroflexi bacterium ADurb.Bin325]
MHAPIWWYVWLGVVLLFGMMSFLRRHGGRLPPRSGRRVSGRLAASEAGWNDDLELFGEDEHAGRVPQVVAAALDDADRAGRYAMALASHDPSFAPDAPVSPFDAGGPVHMGV